MKTHVSIETTVLIAVTVLALVLCSLTGVPPVSASASSDPNRGPSEHLKAILALHGERKPWQPFEGQFSEPRECSNAVLRHLVQASDEQWQQIEPKFRELEAVRQRTQSTIDVFMVSSAGATGGHTYGGGSGGAARNPQSDYRDARRVRRDYRNTTRRRRRPAPQRPAPRPPVESQTRSGWWRPSQNRKGGPPTEGERLAEQLLDLIESKTSRDERIRKKMAQLTAFRQQAEGEIKAAQEALRQVVTRRQEAMLILMGHLD